MQAFFAENQRKTTRNNVNLCFESCEIAIQVTASCNFYRNKFLTKHIFSKLFLNLFKTHFFNTFLLLFSRIKNGDDDAKSKVLDIAKRRVVHQYYRNFKKIHFSKTFKIMFAYSWAQINYYFFTFLYVVGILEQFEDTLRMFETMLPDFYSGAMTAWRSDCKYSIKH